MEFRTIRALRGPNLWGVHPVLEAWVDLVDQGDTPSDRWPGMHERLLSWLPALAEPMDDAGPGDRSGAGLGVGTSLAHVLARSTLELQKLAGSPVSFCRATGTSEAGVYQLVIEIEEETLARACLETARSLCLGAAHGRAFDAPTEVARLRALAAKVRLGPAAAAVARAARERGIPVIRLEGYSLLHLGQGCHRRRYWLVETDQTSAVASAIAKDKQLTRVLLKAAGVPVPAGRPVDDSESAVAAARELGPAVVVKPQHGSLGRGVAVNLTTPEQVLAAYEGARRVGEEVLVERQVRGDHFRLLVAGGRFLAAVRRSITATSGWYASDVTDRVHPTVAACAERAAAMVGLDVAGLDIVARDIGRPLDEQEGAIVEVNSGPGLLMHEQPDEGAPRPVGRAIVATLFPEGQDGRIPVVAVTGPGDTTATARLIAHVLKAAAMSVGTACADGLFLDDELICRGDRTGPGGARDVFLNPAVEVAVLETAPEGIVREGLGFDRCDVAVVPGSASGDRTGPEVVTASDHQSLGRRLLIGACPPSGAAVLNADDPTSTDLASFCRGSVILFALDDQHSALSRHRDRGGRAVFPRRGTVVLADPSRETVLVASRLIPRSQGNCAETPSPSVMAAVAASWTLGIPGDVIRDALLR